MREFAWSYGCAMLTDIYIEAFDEELADQVWEALMAGGIDDLTACLACWWIVVSGTHKLRPSAPPQI